jgi:hypothetical protein
MYLSELRKRRRHSDQATGCTVPGSNPGSGKRFFSSPKPSRSARDSTSFLLNWVLSQGKSAGGGVKLSTHLHLVPMLRISLLPHYAFMAWIEKPLPYNIFPISLLILLLLLPLALHYFVASGFPNRVTPSLPILRQFFPVFQTHRPYTHYQTNVFIYLK